MDLKPRREETPGDGREFLRTPRGLEFRVGGAPLNADAFDLTDGVIKGGTAVYQNAAGEFIPFPADITATPEAAATACLTAHSVKAAAGSKPVCGFIIKAQARRDRCTGINDAFEEATRNRILFDL